METHILFLMVLTTVVFVVRQSLANRWSWAVTALFSFGAVWLLKPLAMAQSKTQLAAMLQTTSVMQNLLLLVVADSAMFMAACFGPTAKPNTASIRQKTWRTIVNHYPGLSIVPVFYCTLSHTFFHFSGTHFGHLTLGVAIAASIVAGALPWAVGKLLGSHDLARELLFILGIALIATGVLATNSNATVYNAQDFSGWANMAAVLALIALTVLVGVVFFKIKMQLTHKHIKQ